MPQKTASGIGVKDIPLGKMKEGEPYLLQVRSVAQKLIPARLELVYSGDEPLQYKGYLLEGGALWNGWVRPYFTKEVVVKILDDLIGHGVMIEKYRYDESEDNFRYIGDDTLGGIWESLVMGVLGYIMGKSQRIYPLGAGHWTWAIAEDEYKSELRVYDRCYACVVKEGVSYVNKVSLEYILQDMIFNHAFRTYEDGPDGFVLDQDEIWAAPIQQITIKRGADEGGGEETMYAPPMYLVN